MKCVDDVCVFFPVVRGCAESSCSQVNIPTYDGRGRKLTKAVTTGTVLVGRQDIRLLQ
jgi:hypothetical protein